MIIDQNHFQEEFANFRNLNSKILMDLLLKVYSSVVLILINKNCSGVEKRNWRQMKDAEGRFHDRISNSILNCSQCRSSED
jgi:hypothetical protein